MTANLSFGETSKVLFCTFLLDVQLHESTNVFFKLLPLVMGDQRGTTSLGMEGKRRPSSLSRDRCNSHASQRHTGVDRGSRSNMKPEVGECWIQDSCQGGVVQYCNNSHGSSRATTPSQIQRSATLQGAKGGQELYDSMKRAMEKKLRENRHSCQDQTTSTNFWKPVCRKEPEAEIKRNDVYELVPRLPSLALFDTALFKNIARIANAVQVTI